MSTNQIVLPETTEKSHHEENTLALRKAGADAKNGVDSHSDNESVAASISVPDGSPTVATNEHTDKENGRQPAFVL